ncbi:MAG: InlB B-repeat-containing protein, partial [Oscillospiraceae bacterium]|nr:InlB B-repeat-containing protein [Oscillospiraceae bacterium]
VIMVIGMFPMSAMALELEQVGETEEIVETVEPAEEEQIENEEPQESAENTDSATVEEQTEVGEKTSEIQQDYAEEVAEYTTTGEAEPAEELQAVKLASLSVRSGSTYYLHTEGDGYGTEETPLFNSDTLEYELPDLKASKAGEGLNFRATATDSAATIKAYFTKDGQEVETTIRSWGASVYGVLFGECEIRVVVSCEGYTSTTYVFNFNGCGITTPRIYDVVTGEEYIYFDAEGNTINYQDIYNVPSSVKILKTTTELRLVGSVSSGCTVAYNGAEAELGQATINVADVDEIVVKTTTESGVGNTEYSIAIEKVEPASIKFDIIEGATVTVKLNGKALASSEEDPTRVDNLMPGAEYTYLVRAKGYLAKEGTFVAGTDTEIKVELEPIKKTEYINYESEWPSFRGDESNMAIVEYKTPRNTDEAEQKWAVQIGNGGGFFVQSPTPPIIINDVDINGEKRDVLAVACSNSIYLLDKETGEILVSGKMYANAGFATNPITYAEGLIFVQQSTTVQAFNAATLEPVWLSEAVNGQTISPITYHDGYIYIGTWQGESAEGTFYCFSVNDDDPTRTDETKYAEWTLNHFGGFYWAGAYVCDEYAVFGSDDGTAEGDYTANAVLYSVNPETGEIIDKIENIKGDIRSSISFDDESDTCYAVTKGGLFIKAPINADGTFKKDEFATLDMGNMCTSTPIILEGRAYIGTSGAYQFGSAGVLNVIDVENMEKIAGLALPGYPQAPIMASTGYMEETGKVYFYSTYNARPGGLFAIEWDMNIDAYSATEIYVPARAQQNYCICAPVADSEGTIYYKNDSGYLMAIGVNKAYATDITVDGESVKGFSVSDYEYDIIVDGKESVTISAEASEGSEVLVTVGGSTKKNSNTVELSVEEQVVTIIVTNNNSTRTYTVNIRKSSDAFGITAIGGYTSWSGGTVPEYEVSPAYSDDVDEYFFYNIPEDVSEFWIMYNVADETMTIKAYATAGHVYFNAGDELATNTGSSDPLQRGSCIYFTDSAVKSGSIRIEFASEDGTKTRTIYVTATTLSEEEFNARGGITSFIIDGKPASIDYENKTISLTLPKNEVPDDVVAHMTTDIRLTEGSTISPASGVEQDFTDPVKYTVTNGAVSVEYTVTVTIGPSSDTGIISVSYDGVELAARENSPIKAYDLVFPAGTEYPQTTEKFEVVTSDPEATYVVEAGSYLNFYGYYRIAVTAPSGAIEYGYVYVGRENAIVTFDPNGGECDVEFLETSNNRIGRIPTPTREGYVFEGWYTEIEGGEKINRLYAFTVDTTVYARWSEDPNAKAAAEVESLISAIGEVTLESEDAIKAAREAYDALTDEQKALVENYDVLEAAEKALDALKNPQAPVAPNRPSDEPNPGVTVVIPRGEDETNPNTGAPVESVSALCAVAVLAGMAIALKKIK